jgi:hypothetical protein
VYGVGSYFYGLALALFSAAFGSALLTFTLRAMFNTITASAEPRLDDLFTLCVFEGASFAYPRSPCTVVCLFALTRALPF